MTNVGRSRLVLYLAAVLSYVAALIHFFVIPQHFEEWWGYGTFFLGVGAFQGLYALVLLQWPGPSLFFSGIAANLAIVALWLVTRTVGIPFFGPHAGEMEAIGAADLAATTVELALSVALVALWRSARQPAALLPGGAADASENRPDLSVWRGAWRGERVLMLVGVAAVATLGTALVMTLLTRPPGDGSPEAGFARDISVHHAQAVEMAEIVRDRTESEEVRTLATDIALTQQAQIG
jgi:hypothetical protein